MPVLFQILTEALKAELTSELLIEEFFRPMQNERRDLMKSHVTLNEIFCERLQIFTHLVCGREVQQLTAHAWALPASAYAAYAALRKIQ